MSSSEAKSPAELRAERFNNLRSEWNRLSSRVTLGHLNDELEDTAGQLQALPHEIAELRKRGYRYSRDWEAKARTLGASWPERSREARRILQEQARGMADLAREIRELCDRSMLFDSALDQLEAKLDRLESQIGSAESNVRGAFDSLREQLYEVQREFKKVERLLDWLDTASFALYPDENSVAACSATWANHPNEPQCILFLTDGRLLLEQREKKAKKKVLFVTTESELIQGVLWEVPAGNVARLEAEDKKKFLSRQELLHLSFREYTSGLHGDVTLHLEDTSNEEWIGLIKRVQSGEIEADRYDAPAMPAGAPAGAVSPAAAKEMPTKCPACGGKLPALVKGMREIVCQYCGTSVRL